MKDKKQLLLKNTILNFLGIGGPLIVAAFTLPSLIQGIGTDKFGLLTIIWIVISYFGLFDLGLGRAVTQLISRNLGSKNNDDEISVIVWTSSISMIILGVFGGLLLWNTSLFLVEDALNIPEDLTFDTIKAFKSLSFSVPFITSTAGLVGILSSYQRFDLINYVRVPSSLLIFVGPLFVLPFSKKLSDIVFILVATRILTWFIHLIQCFFVIPRNDRSFRLKVSLIPKLLRFGGWMTVSNIIGPIMVYMDRFFIGSFLSISSVAFYTTPFEVITKLTVLPNALVAVLFPEFSSTFFTDPEKSFDLYRRAVKYISLILFPIITISLCFSSALLQAWLGNEFAEKSTLVLKFLSVGVYFNCVAYVPFSFIQGASRPDITAKIHIIELPIYLSFIFVFIKIGLGIEGVSFVWLLRVLFDAIVLLMISENIFPLSSKSKPRKDMVFIFTYSTIAYIFLFLTPVVLDQKWIILETLVFIALFLYLSWTMFLEKKDRESIGNGLSKIKKLVEFH